MSDDVKLLQAWLKRTRESQLGHYAAAERNSVRHLYIGIPAAIFSAVVGTAVFSALGSSQELDIKLRFLVASISIVTAILTGCQTFLRFSEKSDAHRAAAAKFAELRRLIELSLSFPATITPQRADEIRTAFDAATQASPTVPSAVWNKAIALAGNDYFVPGSKPAEGANAAI